MLGGLMVLIGIAGCLDIYLFLSHRSTVAVYRQKIDQLKQEMAESESVGAGTPLGLSKGEKEAVTQQVKFINTLIMKDIFPWPRVLDMLETDLPEDMLLERVTHSQDYKTLVLLGAAGSPDVVASFMDRLNENPFFKKNRLVSLSVETIAMSVGTVFKGNFKFEIVCDMNVNDVFTGMDIQQ